MYRIIDNRSSGKTGRLMLIAKENKAIFVCKNPFAMAEKAKNYGLIGIDFMSYADFINLAPEKRFNQNYVIDELEDFVSSQLDNLHFTGYTISNGD